MVEKRYIQVFILAVTTIIGSILNYSMSTSLVSMINSNSSDRNYQIIKWKTKGQSFVLGGYLLGFCLFQLPFNYLVIFWQNRVILSFTLFFGGILHLSIPFIATHYDWVGVFIIRILTGSLLSSLTANVTNIQSNWSTLNDRSRISSFISASSSIAKVIGSAVPGLIATTILGWPGIFYIFGCCAAIWAVIIWFSLVDSPIKHPKISEKEKSLYVQNSSIMEPEQSPPWKHIMSSSPVWAIIIAGCGNDWATSSLLMQIPYYMTKILKLQVTSAGLFTAFPYLTLWILAFPISWISDYAVKKGCTVSHTRKFCNTIGMWIPAALILSLCYAENELLVIAITILTVTLNAGTHCGYLVNLIDISPNYAGFIKSFMYCLGAIFSFISPLVWGIIVEDQENINQWKTIFILNASILFVSNLIFIIFGKGDVQYWNDLKKKHSKDSTINILA